MPDYGWNPFANRYVNLDTGRFVSSTAVRNALEDVMEVSAINMNTLSQQLVNGEVSLADWQRGMMQQVKLSHTAAAASANGGFAQMTQSDWGFAGSLIRKQYDYLNNFAGQIANGEQGLNGQVIVRADLYGQAARGTFEAQRQRLEVSNGMEEERRILEIKDGANCEGCIEQAELGWQPIGTLDPIGAEECLTNCRCEFEYRRAGETVEEE
jgi:hypothetical protein